MQTQSQHSSMGSSFSAVQDHGDMVIEQDDRQERQEQQHGSHAFIDNQNTDQRESKNDETKCQSKIDSDENRILRRGDLVRIVARKKAQAKHQHIGALGRIIKSVKVETGDGKHPFIYDIDLVLGGKIHGMERDELAYTTADVEGMTGESRARRKRKPSTTAAEDFEGANGTAKKGPTKTTKSKTGPAASKSKAGTTKKQKKSTTTAGTGKSSSNTAAKAGKKRANDGKTTNSTAKKAKTTKKSTTTTEDTEPSSTATGNTTMELYERHRREFERSLVRLEKNDTYQYFLGDVPEEFEETYQETGSTSDNNDANVGEATSSITHHNDSNSASFVSATTNAQHNATDSLASLPAVPKNSIGEGKGKKSRIGSNGYPDHPPYNFVVIRQRMERGRYVIDLQAREEEERFQRLAPYFKSLNKRLSRKIRRKNNVPKKTTDKKGRPFVFLDKMNILHPTAVNWELFRRDVIGMCDAAVERHPELNSLGSAARRIKETMEQIYEKTGKRHIGEMSVDNDRHRFNDAMESFDNIEPAMQGKWRKTAFPQRMYERLKSDVVCAGLSELDGRIATYELCTSLKDSFLGLAYTYDDTGQSEGWMKSVLNETEEEKAASALARDDGVIKAQVDASMNSLLIAVQDRVMTDMKVLEQEELRSSNWEVSESPSKSKQLKSDPSSCGSLAPTTNYPEIVEQEVWGIDCYTRRNISICLETELDPDTVLVFIEKWLLPAINACPVDRAHDISNAARILEGLPFEPESTLAADGGTTDERWRATLLGKALLNKISTSGPPWLKAAASLLRRACESIGADFFRVHPKGHGSIVLCPKLEANRLVTFYRGEVYPSWRWGEKMDAIEITQQRKGLKPVLPDFFNMALERPQLDPRGYGLMFVDASRKAGHGSMLSHSCQPSCEVRVAAYKGELTLAMTTLREMSIGEELTFDYNAVTESVNEYHSAICLCGYGQCRGSFLHFATADCYQQVLNRNSPIAVRLSNLIKGCMKKVMSEEDERILQRHGFHTAAFGAISINRRKANKQNAANLDSLDIVPVWLRTFVADTLRYIEYERRALPIALICNHLDSGRESSSTGAQEQSPRPKSDDSSDSSDDDEAESNTNVKEDNQRIKGSRPEPTFFYYARKEREKFVSIIAERNEADGRLTGIELKKLIQKEASIHWKALDAEAKKRWKDQATREWERNGGREKARLEEERIAARNVSTHPTKVAEKPSGMKSQSKNGDGKKKKKKNGIKGSDSKANGSTEKHTSKDADLAEEEADKISFETADSEGVRAMEQRIQQLTQTLSRVGRVLDRHREKTIPQLFKSGNFRQTLNSPEALRGLVHSPMSIMDDAHVVAWMWNHNDGIVRVLLRAAQGDVSVSPSMKESLLQTELKFRALEKFGTPWKTGISENQELPMSPSEGRKQLTEALLEFRACLLNGIKDMANDIKTRRALSRAQKKKTQALQAQKEAAVEERELIVTSIINDLIDQAVYIADGTPPVSNPASTPISPPSNEAAKVTPEEEVSRDLDPWLENFNKRFKIEKAADLLLIYARTTTFFRLEPYEPLESSPIEVYARELGNSVPRSAIDDEKQPTHGAVTDKMKPDSTNERDDDIQSQSSRSDSEAVISKKSKKAKPSGLCEPDDIITEVVVKYQGDYVLSQLLQWFNYGIGQKPGLPDMLGCILLPSMHGCWNVDSTQVSNSKTIRTKYHTHTRPRLVEWLKDPIQRGNPWPDELRKAFVEETEPSVISDASSLWLPFGSPIMDFLVTGDDFGLASILGELGISDNNAENSTANGLLSTLDQGKPAQAVSNWVQCDKCSKWRRLPWHVDVDTLGDQFFCEDNIWNPPSATCDAPEDEWNAELDAQVALDGSAYAVETVAKNEPPESEVGSSGFEPSDFSLGARFDVLRTGKEKWAEGVVVDLDFEGNSKRVKFHFPKLHLKFDEWVDISSPRLASLHSKTAPPKSLSKSLSSTHKNSETGDVKHDEKNSSKLSLIASNNEKGGQSVEKSTFVAHDASMEGDLSRETIGRGRNEDLRDTSLFHPLRAESSHGRLSPGALKPIRNGYSEDIGSYSYRENHKNETRYEGISITSENSPNSTMLNRRDGYRDNFDVAENDDGHHRRVPRKGHSPTRHPFRPEDAITGSHEGLLSEESHDMQIPRKSSTTYPDRSMKAYSPGATDVPYSEERIARTSDDIDYASRHSDRRSQISPPRQASSLGGTSIRDTDRGLPGVDSSWRDASDEHSYYPENRTRIPWKPRYRQELHLSSYYAKSENRDRNESHDYTEIPSRSSQISSSYSPRMQTELGESSIRDNSWDKKDAKWLDHHRDATEIRRRRDYSPPPSPRRQTYVRGSSIRDKDHRFLNSEEDRRRESGEVTEARVGHTDYQSPSNHTEHRYLKSEDYRRREVSEVTETRVSRPYSRSPPRDIMDHRYSKDYDYGSREIGEVPEMSAGQPGPRSSPTTYRRSPSRNVDTDYLKPDDRGRYVSRSDSFGHGEERRYRISADMDLPLTSREFSSRSMEREYPRSGQTDWKETSRESNFRSRDVARMETVDRVGADESPSQYRRRDTGYGKPGDDRDYRGTDESLSAYRHKDDRYGKSTDDREYSDSAEFSVRRKHDVSDGYHYRSYARTHDDDKVYADSERYSAPRQLELGRTSPSKLSRSSTTTRRYDSLQHRAREHSPHRVSDMPHDDDESRYRDSKTYSSHQHSRSSPRQMPYRSSSPSRRDSHSPRGSHEGSPRKFRETSRYDSRPSYRDRQNYDSHQTDAHHSPSSHRSDKGSPYKGQEGSPAKSGSFVRSSTHDVHDDSTRKSDNLSQGLFRGEIAKRFELPSHVDPSVISSCRQDNSPRGAH